MLPHNVGVARRSDQRARHASRIDGSTMTHQKLGTCYYPEHVPEQRWARDAARMRDIGLSTVRIGEFAWSRLEPRSGHYCFDWIERAIDTLHAEGLRVVLGTPTAAPPRWLVDIMPDMVALDASGRPRRFGSRRHYCFSHLGYAHECERIVVELAKAFGTHPGVVAWQVDNEYGCHDTIVSYSAAALHAFRRWCRTRYETIAALNEAWGNVFWSMELASFDAVELPNLVVTEANPAHRLDFQRFSSDQVVVFNRRQVDILRRYAPGRPILHNFMGASTDFDHHDVARDLDVASWDSYPLGFLDRSAADDGRKLRYHRIGDPDFQAFHHDLYRACGRRGWWVMEQQPGGVNWGSWNPLPAPGAVRLWTYEAFAAGAEVVSYFPWRQVPFAQEQMHEALLLPNDEPSESAHTAATIARELEDLDAQVATLRTDVALVFDYESAWAWSIVPHGRDFCYFDLLLDFYRGLRRAGVSVDVVPPAPEAVRGRRLVLLPGLFAPRGDFVEALAASEAVVAIGPRSGSKTESFRIPGELPPGSLRRLIDVAVHRAESLRPGVTIPIAASRGRFERWREILLPGSGVEPTLATTRGEVALARSGARFYVAGWPDEALLDEILRRLLDLAGVERLVLGEDIRIRDNGSLRYVLNYGPEPANIASLVGDARLVLGEMNLSPYGVAAFRREER
jgi:beta-galactosidase